VPDEPDYIVYELRPGEAASKVARMFHVTVAELLALNHITDPDRLVAGTTLRIPDPRATRMARLRTEKGALERELAAAHDAIGDLRGTIGRLESQLSDLRHAKQGLERAQLFYQFWRAGALIGAGAAVAAGFGLLVAWAKARDEARRRHLAAKEAEMLHLAVEKHRQLSGQFELKYQGLFHQVGLPAAAQARAQALRRAYDEDRARLDAIIAEAEQEIKGAAAALPAARDTKQAKAPVTRLSAARKNG
jgi:LysM repeat protein